MGFCACGFYSLFFLFADQEITLSNNPSAICCHSAFPFVVLPLARQLPKFGFMFFFAKSLKLTQNRTVLNPCPRISSLQLLEFN
jgi:hypothetical protein